MGRFGILNPMPKKLYIETVGCQMNVLDSELVVGGLKRQGYELTATPADADLILYNTCSVRQHAEDKIYSALGRLRGHMARHPHKVLGVLGCMAQKDQELIVKRAPHVDLKGEGEGQTRHGESQLLAEAAGPGAADHVLGPAGAAAGASTGEQDPRQSPLG